MIELIGYLLAAAAGIVFSVFFLRDSRVRFVSVFFLVVSLSLKTEHASNSLLDYIAAAIFTGSFIYIIIKKKIIDRQPIVSDPLFIFYSLFLVWGLLLGIISIFIGNVSIEKWYRDVLLFISPLFLIPAFFEEMRTEKKNIDNVFGWCILSMWLIIFLVSIIRIRSSVATAFYAYELGRVRIDNFNGSFMCLVFLSLSFITTGAKRWLMLGGIIISSISLFLTFGRAVEAATILSLPIIFLFAEPFERRQGLRFVRFSFAILIPLFILAFFSIPLFRIAILLGIEKLFSSVNIKTDASMYGRYVEWRSALKTIFTLPLTGKGFGSEFLNYGWLGGYSFTSNYIHNAFYAVLLRTGIIGVILLAIPSFGFVFKGFKYLRNKYLTLREKAYLRAAMATMVIVAINGYTTPIFIQRDEVIYIALFWCFIMNLQWKISDRKRIVRDELFPQTV